MAHNRQSSTAHFIVPRPTTSSDVEDIDLSSTQVDPNSRTHQLGWSDAMDGCMISSLVHQVLASHKRSDNGFTTFQVSKVVESVYNERGVVELDKNINVRVKTLKKDYVEVASYYERFWVELDNGLITVDTIA
ncbi:Uncharacterized protein Adt_31995 [Abeliophyllum distichum]|uniref:Myb/SANT-like domain-containing protein n=1 Tax=Abeliophyllum distichum TaxID=126358 RepID=A0ABD1RJD6_9LAMI